MSNWEPVSAFVKFTTKGITPTYVDNSTIIVLNQKCIRNNKIDYSFAQFTDDSKDISATKFVQKGDILVNSTGTGTAGRSAFVAELPKRHRLIVDSHILILRCNSINEAQCLSYNLYSFEKKLMSFMTGSSGQSELDKVVLLNIKTKIPKDSTTQIKIASILSSLESKIELNNRINAGLEAMAKTMYDYWFVQFDFPCPELVEGPLANSDIVGKPYKTSGGKMVWNEELKRKIPEGWNNGSFGDYANLKGGYAFKSSWWKEKGVPVIKIKDINEDSTLSLENCAFVGEDKYSLTKNYEAFTGDVVIALTGATIGKYGIVTKSQKPILVNQRVGLFKLGIKPLEKLPFLINSLNQEYFRKTVFVIASGAAQPNISTDQIDEIPLVIPRKEILDNFNLNCSFSYKNIIKNQIENQQLTSLRDWLLPLLMNGQVKVCKDNLV